MRTIYILLYAHSYIDFGCYAIILCRPKALNSQLRISESDGKWSPCDETNAVGKNGARFSAVFFLSICSVACHQIFILNIKI